MQNVLFGPLAGELLLALAGLIAAPLAAAVVALAVQLGRKLGVDIKETRRARLQEIVENGIRDAAARSQVALNGKLSAQIRDGLVADAADYLARHGAETLRKLRGDPRNKALLEELVRGRGGHLLGIDPDVVFGPLTRR